MRDNGFRVNPVNMKDPAVIRRKYGIPDHLDSCHTSVVDGYAIVGHVPAREVKRLLEQRPKARGLSVARMPAGSPGMKASGQAEPYDVVLVMQDGTEKLYARYNRDGTSRVYP
jgi:hypothetical protein